MDLHHLVVITQDQLKGGIGEDQIRELLRYRGVAEPDIESIMNAAKAGLASVDAPEDARTVAGKTEAMLSGVMEERELQMGTSKKGKLIIASAIMFGLFLVGAGVYLYYRYF